MRYAHRVGGPEDGPTLGAAWTMLGTQLGLAVEERGERSIRALGVCTGGRWWSIVGPPWWIARLCELANTLAR